MNIRRGCFCTFIRVISNQFSKGIHFHRTCLARRAEIPRRSFVAFDSRGSIERGKGTKRKRERERDGISSKGWESSGACALDINGHDYSVAQDQTRGHGNSEGRLTE